MRHKNIVHISDVPSEPLPTPEGTSFGGLRQRVGVAVGAQKLGYGLFTVPPGKTAFPLHVHTLNEELIHILDGEGTLRFGDETVAVRAGMFIACPGGVELTHQLVNTSEAELRYLCVSTMQYPDIVHYPDSGKVGVYAGPGASGQKPFRGIYKKGTEVPYFQDETGPEVKERP